MGARDSYGRNDADSVPRHRGGFGEQLLYLHGAILGVLRVVDDGVHDELIPAVTSHEFAFAGDASEQGRDLNQQQVPQVMTPRIVDAFEVVEIEEENGYRAVRALGSMR